MPGTAPPSKASADFADALSDEDDVDEFAEKQPPGEDNDGGTVGNRTWLP